MPRKKRKARVSKRHISVRPVYRARPDTQALAKALVLDALKHRVDSDGEGADNYRQL
jgi:hypothetical protein